MANYYTKMSVMLDLPEPVIDWVMALHGAIQAIADDEIPEHGGLVSPMWDMSAGEMMLLASRIHQEIDSNTGLDVTRNPAPQAGLWIRDIDGQVNLDYAVLLIQEILEYTKSDLAVAFQYACTADKPRTDAYGGGAVVVMRDKVFREDSAETLKRALDEMVPPSAPVMAGPDMEAPGMDGP